MVLRVVKPSLREASCCRVEVVNGGAGRRLRSLLATSVTCSAPAAACWMRRRAASADSRSEEHTSELQSRENLVCRLLLDKKNVMIPSVIYYCASVHRDLHSFPTRRSSDLLAGGEAELARGLLLQGRGGERRRRAALAFLAGHVGDVQRAGGGLLDAQARGLGRFEIGRAHV